MFLAYEEIEVAGAVLTNTAFTKLPSTAINGTAGATHAELRAFTGGIRYIMDDGGSDPPAENNGMVMLTADPPKAFLIEDLNRMRFIRSTVDCQLLVHYFGGRGDL